MTFEPLLGKDMVRSWVVEDSGFNIAGKVGEINPLTGDIIFKNEDSVLYSRSTALEIEVWQIIKKQGKCSN